MVGRLNFLFLLSHVTMAIIASVGLATALFAGIIGFAQNDIKKVLAYSTISQLGFMFLGAGVGNFTGSIFHVVTHAFFKACLFLGAGSVILGMHHEQNIHNYGGIKKYMPITFFTFLFAAIAICGIFPFAGFFSKDEIILNAFISNKWLWVFAIIGAGMTSFYMSRLCILTFFGKERHNSHDKIHESPYVITIPLIILAILSLSGGFIGLPEIFYHHNYISEFLHSVFISRHAETSHVSHALEIGLMITSMGISILGIFCAYLIYVKKPQFVTFFTQNFKLVYKLVYNKFFVDEIYHKIFVQNILCLTKFLGRFDLVVIDGLVNLQAILTKFYAYTIGWVDNTFVDGAVNTVASVTISTGNKLKKLQTGKIQNYAYTMFLSVLVIIIAIVLVNNF
jgi:NADH-quinone oxidoreductase subunit L